MKIYRVTDKEFLPYGNVLDFDTKEILEEAEKIEMPTDGSMYVPTKEEFEKLSIQTSKDGFGCIVGLLKETSTDLDFVPEDKLVFCKNKWIIAHEDNAELIAQGVFGGIYGENYKI